MAETKKFEVNKEDRWPKDSVNMFKNDKKSQYFIEISSGTNLHEEFYKYAANFKNAAYFVTEHVLETGAIDKLDTYFFAIAFLYRHSLELIMKAIGFKYVPNRESFIEDTFHNLFEIMSVVNNYIQPNIQNNVAAHEWLMSYLIDIGKIDKASDSFRYPFLWNISKCEYMGEGKRRYDIESVFKEQTHIDLVKFANKMEVAFAIIESYYFDAEIKFTEHSKYSPIFLEEGGPYKGQSVVGYPHNQNKYDPYIKAYVESAIYLKNLVMTNTKTKEDMFFPMCYLFRNSIELGLKQIWFCYGDTGFQEICKQIFDRKHSVLRLWTLIEETVENDTQMDGTIEIVRKYINQLHNYDPSSDKFRYPCDRHLNFHFKNAIELDFENVAEFFEELAEFFDRVDLVLGLNEEWRAEAESNYTR